MARLAQAATRWATAELSAGGEKTNHVRSCVTNYFPLALQERVEVQGSFSLDQPFQQDGVVDIIIVTALEADGNAAVDDVKGPMALDLAGIGP